MLCSLSSLFSGISVTNRDGEKILLRSNYPSIRVVVLHNIEGTFITFGTPYLTYTSHRHVQYVKRTHKNLQVHEHMHFHGSVASHVHQPFSK